ncbi:MAG TPA: hypothetical protein PLO33_20185, partial [Kouleothrix sp.]|nr:hypothetical protein [Kouleothrix sp.]
QSRAPHKKKKFVGGEAARKPPPIGMMPCLAKPGRASDKESSGVAKPPPSPTIQHVISRMWDYS